jgi:hypothetical protein
MTLSITTVSIYGLFATLRIIISHNNFEHNENLLKEGFIGLVPGPNPMKTFWSKSTYTLFKLDRFRVAEKCSMLTKRSNLHDKIVNLLQKIFVGSVPGLGVACARRSCGATTFSQTSFIRMTFYRSSYSQIAF